MKRNYEFNGRIKAEKLENTETVWNTAILLFETHSEIFI